MRGMMKLFLRIFAMALAVLPPSMIAQTASPAAAPTTSEVPVAATEANELLRLQRDIQTKQLQQQAMEAQAKKEIDALVEQYSQALNRVRTAMKIPADAQFDGYKVAFVVPKPAAATKAAK
jgi:hypothetical protein